jgi:hypothetical protein
MRVALNGANPDPSVREQTESNGFNLRRHKESGAVLLTISLPGLKAAEFTRTGLERVVATLDREIDEGSGPGAVFAQSAHRDADGNLTAQLSREKRARKVTIPADQVEDMSGFFCALLDNWEKWEGQLDAAEAPAEAATE